MKYQTVLHLHTMVGTVVLASFWITALSRKGGHLHRLTGKVYLIGIALILVSVIPMIIIAIQGNHYSSALGLGFLSVMTFTAGWIARKSIALKNDLGRYTGSGFKALAIILTTFGFAVLLLNILHGTILYAFFACTGLTLAGSMWHILFVKDVKPNWYLHQHLNGVALLFAATHASFLRFGLTKLVPLIPDSEEFNTVSQMSVILLALFLRLTLARNYIKILGPKSEKSSRSRTYPIITKS